MKSLALVMVHRDAQETAARHLPFWKKTADRVVYTYPKNGGPLDTSVEQVEIGEMEHHGPISRERIIKILTWALKQEWDFLHLHEYDSIATDVPKRALPNPGGMAGTVYANNKPEVFTAPIYIHYPHIYTRTALRRVLAVMLLGFALEENPEDVFWSDRFIGLAAVQSGVDVKDHRSLGLSYSKNTIEPSHIDALRRAVSRGARFFHGIKTQEVLGVITG